MSTAEERAWERERKRRLDEAGEAEAGRLNEEIQRRVGTLDQLLVWSLNHPVSVAFMAMKVPVPQFQPGALAVPLPPPNPETFKPRPLTRLTRLMPGAEERFAARWEQGRVAYDQACANWQWAEQQRQHQFARAKAEHEAATAMAQEQHRRVDELEAGFRTGRRAAIEQCLTTALQASQYPAGFPHAFTLIYRSRERELLVEYEFPRVRDIIPTDASFRYVKTRGFIESKARTATDTQRLYKAVLAQVTLRVLHELFAADLHGHVQRIAFNGVVDDIDPSTGRPTRPKLVSLRIDRETFLERDLSRVEPQRALKGLKANFSPAPTELEAIPPILAFDVNDPRFIEEEEILSGLDERTNLIDLTPYAFETVIRDLFQAMGFDTYQTRPSRDGGVDCVAHYTKSVIGGKYVIQAKRYIHRVPVEAVRDLAGALDHERASKGILVTTSDFTQAGYQFAQGKPIELINGSGLLDLFKEHTNMDLKIVMPSDPRNRGSGP
jgi:restriction system protein